MVKIYLDENLSANVIHPLTKLLKRGYEFRTPAMESLSGEKDIPLFEHLQLLGYDLIATMDRRQLSNDDERDALRASGLHWVGLVDPMLSGVQQVAAESSALLLSLPTILSALPAEPTVFHVDTVTMRNGVRLSSEPV